MYLVCVHICGHEWTFYPLSLLPCTCVNSGRAILSDHMSTEGQGQKGYYKSNGTLQQSIWGTDANSHLIAMFSYPYSHISQFYSTTAFKPRWEVEPCDAACWMLA